MRTKTSALFLAMMWLSVQTGGAQSPDRQPGAERSLSIASSTLLWPALAEPQGAAQASQDIAGDWNGTLDVQGQKLRLVLHLKKNADGKLAGTLDSLDQGANDIPLSAVEHTGDDVKLELAGMAAGYQGKLNAAGTEITGEWKQGGGSLPLVLKRVGDKTDQKTPKGLPATLAGFEDQASFYVVLNEERLASMQSTWKKDGSFENHAAISLAGQKAEVTTRIVPDADGRWATISLESAVAKVTLTRQGSSVTRTAKDKSTTWETRDGLLLFENNSPALVSQALRMYDRAKGGAQKFPLLILPGSAADLTLESKETSNYAIAGKDLTLTKFLYGLPGLDIFVWADSAGKAYLIEVPAQKAAFVREGYEALRKAKASEASLSAPKYEVVVDKSVAVPMRDGVKLVMDIYRPQGVEKAPVILVRTPYKKEMTELQAKYYARRGYVYAVQDCRGRFGSGGVWEPFVNEAKDGYDTIEWLAGQPFSDGKVGMIGGSYLGWVQWWAASEHPPHLVTIIPNVAPPDPFYNVPYEYGAFFMEGAIWWADILESGATADISGVALSRIGEKKYSKLLRTLPVIDLDKSVLGKENPYWRKWIQHPSNDDYWKPANFLDRLKDVNIPVFHQSGWFDGDGIGTKLNYAKMASFKHSSQKLTVGPWGHTDTAARMIGDRDFGETAIIDLQRDYLRWFDHWLKGMDNGIEKEPLVSLFVMGSNKWLHGQTYPLEITKPQKLYLSSAGNANTAKGDGRLVFDSPAANTPSDRYAYDPGDPTPDPRAYEESEENEKKTRSADERKKEAQGYHQKTIDERKDILVYVTEPLSKPLTFAGPVSAVLYAASSARDTDWFVTLCEVDKDEKIFPLAMGKIRARFRRSMSAPELLKANEVNEYTLDLWHTGITVPAGSRLRIEVASAVFPYFSRNLNTGGHNETEMKYVTAHQTIYHSQKYPSHILLPVIPEP